MSPLHFNAPQLVWHYYCVYRLQENCQQCTGLYYNNTIEINDATVKTHNVFIMLFSGMRQVPSK